MFSSQHKQQILKSLFIAAAMVLCYQLAVKFGVIRGAAGAYKFVTPIEKRFQVPLELLTSWLFVLSFVLGGRGAGIAVALFAACEGVIACLLKSSVGAYEYICMLSFPASYALLAFLTPWGKGWISRLVRVPMIAVTAFAALQYSVYISYILRFGGHPSPMAVMTVIGTNPNEAGNFITEQFGIVYLLLGLALFALLTVVPLAASKKCARPKTARWCWLLWLLLTAAAWGYRSKADGYSALVFDFKHGIKQIRELRESMQFHKDHSDEVARLGITKQGSGEISVVVIGESATRRHWSAYGYEKPTTSRFGTDPEIVLLKNAYSCMTHTDPTVSMALSRMNNYDPTVRRGGNTVLRTSQTPALPEILRAAGVSTTWYSSHTRAGIYDKYVSAIIVQHTDESYYTCEAAAMREFFTFPDDAELLPLFKKRLEAVRPDENAVIFLHIIGSHWNYADRPPRSWQWGDEKLSYADEYDRSINYTDHILGEILDILRETPAPVKSLFFFADHGEHVGATREESFGHNFDALVPDMTEIPAAFWCSDGYRERWPETVAQIEAHKDAVFTNDLAYEFILGINHISYKGLDTRLQFTSPDYAVTAENARFWQGRMLKDVLNK